MGSQTSKAVIPPAVDEKMILKRELQIQDKLINSLAGLDVGSLGGEAALGEESLNQWAEGFEKNPTNLLSQLILTKNDPIQTLASREALVRDAMVFNLALKGVDGKGEIGYPGPRVNQASSGRCWLFATTNVLRYNVIEQLKLGDFQLSQSYLFFYDKLEKANYYLENVLDLLNEPLEGRLMSFLNEAPVNDGGQWDMAVNVIEKYGIIPQALFPESFSSSSSSRLDSLVTSKLREYALLLRAASNTTTSDDTTKLRQLKSKYLSEIYRTLAITLGTPPKPTEKLKWEYYNRDGKFASFEGTPLDFYEKFGKRKGMDPVDSFSLINDPRNGYEKLYTVERLGNVWGGRPVQYVNAPIEVLEDAVIAGIKANTPLFFGCDVGKASNTKEGVMVTGLYDIKKAYGFDLGMTKAQRLQMGESSMTHAMVITAVHLDSNNRPIRYKVENSWSDSAGQNGWFMMTSDWFKEYVYQVVVPRSIAPKKYCDVLDGGDAVVLKPWDPMGTLA